MRMQWPTLLNSERRRGSKRRTTEFRDEFERDYDRAVFSTPVRRLQDKAQVFPLEPHDAVRTRLTHSLEVSTVARALARKADEWIASKEFITPIQERAISTIAATCGLIHDLGNPPFGHAGEQAISTWFQKQYPNSIDPFRDFANSFGVTFGSLRPEQLASDFWLFEGNAQTLRLISKLQIMSDEYGLNFTYGTLSAVCKYIAASDRTDTNYQERKKPGYFASENDLLAEIRVRVGTGEARNPITYLVEASDDIVYSVVDIEDGVKKGVVNWENIHNALSAEQCPMIDRCLAEAAKGQDDEIRSQLFRIAGIGAMADAVLEIFKHRYEQIMCGEYHEELINDFECAAACFVSACKKFARKNVYTSKETLRLEVMGRQVIHNLMDIFWEGACDPKRGGTVKEFPGKIHGIMSGNYRTIFNSALASGLPESYCQRQLLTDYICGMTDTFACTLHRQLNNG
jgi:dGTPase